MLRLPPIAPVRGTNRGRGWLLLAAATLLTACADKAPSLDSATFAAAYCREPAVPEHVEGLVLWEGPAEAPQIAHSTALRPSLTTLDGVPVASVRELADRFRSHADEARAIAATSVTITFVGRMRFLIEPEVPASRVVAAADAAAGAGFHRFYWLVELPQVDQPPPPPYVVPSFAADLLADAAPWDGSQRQRQLARRITEEVQGCAVAAEVFGDVFHFPDRNCNTIAATVDPLWKECPRQAPRIVTMLQFSQARGPRIGAIVTDWGSEANLVIVPPDMPWRDLVRTIAADDDASFRLEVAAPEPDR